MADTVRLGDSRGLEFQLDSLPRSAQHAEDLAWTAFSASLGGQPVWCAEATPENPSGRLTWTLVDLLQGLGRIWPWLLLEEGYPVPVNPEHPGTLWAEAERRWREDVPATQSEIEADILYDYRQRHDLSLLLRGLHVPPLWVLKEGRDCLLWSPAVERPVRVSHGSVMRTLTAFGDWIAAQLQDAEHPRSRHAVACWQSRLDRVREHAISLITGLAPDEIEQILSATSAEAQASDAASFFELGDAAASDFQPGELLMAARMTRNRLDWTAQRQLLDVLRLVPQAATPELDRLADLAGQIINADDHPWHQGYDLANWLRKHLGYTPEQAINPRDILSRWQVGVEAMRIEGSIDAAAVWGTARGPHVLWNEHPHSRASTQNGFRTALAHEICHLLIDRRNALPVVEVLGGQVSPLAEKRANAFAAELLLPREHAAQVCRGHEDLPRAADQLEASHHVSREVVYYQIQNSSFYATMNAIEHRQLDNWRLSGRHAP